MKTPSKLNLADHLKRNLPLRAELTRATTASEVLTLNYRWEQKNGQERAYLELILGKEQRNEHCIRLYYVPVYVQIARDEGEVQQLVQEAALTVQRELEEIIGDEHRGKEIIRNETVKKSPITFQSYYLKGERQEHYFGKIG